MNERQEMCIRDISVLLGEIRKVQEEAAVIRCKYRDLEKKYEVFEKNSDGEKRHDIIAEQNQIIFNMILGRLDIIQDTTTTNRVIMKRLLRQLNPSVEA